MLRSIILLLTCCTGLVLSAQAPARDAFLDHLAGQWNATGTIGGDRVGYTITAQWTLENNFLRVELRDTARTQPYMADVYIGYETEKKRYVMHWMDTFGTRSSETLGYGTLNGNTIAFRFDYPDGPFINAITFDTASRTWHFHSTMRNSKGEQEVFGDIDLKPR